MKIFYGDSFNNLKRLGYEPIGKPAAYNKNFRLVSDKEIKEMDQLERMLIESSIKNNEKLMKKSEFEEQLKKEIISTNSPYYKFTDRPVKKPYIRCDGIVVYFNYEDELNPSFKIGGKRTGNDRVTAIAIRKIKK